MKRKKTDFDLESASKQNIMLAKELSQVAKKFDLWRHRTELNAAQFTRRISGD